MIAFDLMCGSGHRFEGWFGSSKDFDVQKAGGHIACPLCNSANVEMALSVPNVGRKSNQVDSHSKQLPVVAEPVTGEVMNAPTLPPAMVDMMQKLAIVQTEMLKESDWVGRDFAETARAIHYGEEADRLIHGETSADEAVALAEEGISIAPLPFPVVPPTAKN
jgi:hypothetical protein